MQNLSQTEMRLCTAEQYRLCNSEFTGTREDRTQKQRQTAQIFQIKLSLHLNFIPREKGIMGWEELLTELGSGRAMSRVSGFYHNYNIKSSSSSPACKVSLSFPLLRKAKRKDREMEMLFCSCSPSPKTSHQM